MTCYLSVFFPLQKHTPFVKVMSAQPLFRCQRCSPCQPVHRLDFGFRLFALPRHLCPSEKQNKTKRREATYHSGMTFPICSWFLGVSPEPALIIGNPAAWDCASSLWATLGLSGQSPLSIVVLSASAQPDWLCCISHVFLLYVP